MPLYSQLSQYLLNADNTTLKLNDFNRAEFMLWNDKEGEYCKYGEGTGNGNVSSLLCICVEFRHVVLSCTACTIRRKIVHDRCVVRISFFLSPITHFVVPYVLVLSGRYFQWRSPEEYFNYDLNEQVDVYSLGNNMYSLLTGLYVFYDEDNDDKVKERVKQREKPFIDPRYTNQSLAEAKLAEIIDRCHSFLSEDRPNIFDVVRFLSDALKEVTDSMESDEVE